MTMVAYFKQEWLEQISESNECVIERVKEIVSANDFRATKHEGDANDDWFSVYVYSEKANYGQWFDISADGERCDWNAYIFSMCDFRDVVDKCVQNYCTEEGDAIMFMEFESVAREYLETLGLLK